MTESIIIDCDPGQDDAVALLMAMARPDDLELLGVTTVAGNVPLALTQRNARLMCDLAERQDVPVFAGCERPLARSLVTAEAVHGHTGIDGVEIRTPQTPLQQVHAVDFLIETLRQAAQASVTLVPVGPLTNVAMALVKAPDIAKNIRRIVLMGGAMREGGNTTPSAEFNIYVDPHAASTVFQCGLPIVAMGLDVTHQVIANSQRRQRIRDLSTPQSAAVADMLSFYARFDSTKYGTDGAPLHDPCTIAYLLKPELFSGRDCHISVETQSSLTMGHTAVDYWGVTDKPSNALWIDSVDADGFYDVVTDTIARYQR